VGKGKNRRRVETKKHELDKYQEKIQKQKQLLQEIEEEGKTEEDQKAVAKDGD